jgi:hypothetical protein
MQQIIGELPKSTPMGIILLLTTFNLIGDIPASCIVGSGGQQGVYGAGIFRRTRGHGRIPARLESRGM